MKNLRLKREGQFHGWRFCNNLTIDKLNYAQLGFVFNICDKEIFTLIENGKESDYITGFILSIKEFKKSKLEDFEFKVFISQVGYRFNDRKIYDIERGLMSRREIRKTFDFKELFITYFFEYGWDAEQAVRVFFSEYFNVYKDGYILREDLNFS